MLFHRNQVWCKSELRRFLGPSKGEWDRTCHTRYYRVEATIQSESYHERYALLTQTRRKRGDLVEGRRLGRGPGRATLAAYGGNSQTAPSHCEQFDP